MRVLTVVLMLLLVAAGADARTRLAKPRNGFQMRVGAYEIPGGADVEVCEYRRLPNKKAIDVDGFKLRMPDGAHHFAMWTYGGAVTDDARFPQGPVENVGCTGIAPDELIPQLLIPTTTPNTEFRLPKGVAIRLDPHQQVFLNPHMRNFGDEATAPDVRFNFYKARKRKIEHYAEGLSIGNTTDIRIPPFGEQTLTVEWTSPVDLTLIYLSTHQHSLGTSAFVEIVAPDELSRETVVVTDDWEHPGAVWPKNGRRIVAGQKMRITCEWKNPENREVRFGPETTDEMCFIIGFYYRDPGDETPVVGSGCVGSARGLLCPLAPSVRD